MEMESIEFYKWEKQKALIIKYNTVDPYNEIYFAHYIPFQQITKLFKLEYMEYIIVLLCIFIIILMIINLP